MVDLSTDNIFGPNLLLIVITTKGPIFVSVYLPNHLTSLPTDDVRTYTYWPVV